MSEVNRLIDECAAMYESVVRGVDKDAAEQSDRAYGGMVRAKKGRLTEDIARLLLRAAWLSLGKKAADLQFNLSPKYDIPMREDYIDRIKNARVREHIRENLGEFKIHHGADIHAYARRKFIVSVECKAYAENAMLKRILVDAHLLKTRFPRLRFALLQLESQLGGDYSELGKMSLGSRPSHTLMSYFDVDLTIVTLLEGDRKVDKPIHKPEFYKPMRKENIERAVAVLAEILREADNDDVAD